MLRRNENPVHLNADGRRGTRHIPWHIALQPALDRHHLVGSVALQGGALKLARVEFDHGDNSLSGTDLEIAEAA
ncbi:hypothetical protein D3C71_2141740 [compost metagenome]